MSTEFVTMEIFIENASKEDKTEFLAWLTKRKLAPCDSYLRDFYKERNEKVWIDYISNYDWRLDNKWMLKEFCTLVDDFMREYNKHCTKDKRYGAYTKLETWIKEYAK